MADAVPVNDRRTRLVATAGQTVFDADFEFEAQDEITVAKQGSTLTITTDYTVDVTAQTITLTSGAAENDVVVIEGATPRSRAKEYPRRGSLQTTLVNSDLKRIIWMLQENARDTGRGIVLNISEADSANPELPLLVANAVLAVNSSGNGFSMGPTTTEISNAEANATQVAADAAQVAADKIQTAADVVSAAASAAAAQSAVESAPFRDVKTLTNADSPYAVPASENAYFFSIDTSGGPVVINLPTISGLTLPWMGRFKKETSDANTVTINRGGSDTFADGSTSKIVTAVGGVDVFADDETAPDEWKTANFGASAGNMKVDIFVKTTDFTPGATTLTLSEAPGSENNVELNFGTGGQHTTEYSVSGTTVTIPGGLPDVPQIMARYGTTLPIGVTGDATVDWDKIASSLVSSTAQNQAGAAETVFVTPKGVKEAIEAQAMRNFNSGAIDANSGATFARTGLQAESGIATIQEAIISFQGVSPTGAGDLLLQLGDNAGLKTTTYEGYYERPGVSSGNLSSHFINYWTESGGANTLHGKCKIHLIDADTFTYSVEWWLGRSDSTATADSYCMGTVTLDGLLDRFEFSWDASSSFDGSGKISYQIRG